MSDDEKILKNLSVKLTPDEFGHRATALAESIRQKVELEMELDTMRKSTKKRIDLEEGQIIYLGKVVRDKAEIREVE